MRGAGTPMPPTDPLIYRFYELVMVNGPAWKALIEEEFGDGIMSAIDFDGFNDAPDMDAFLIPGGFGCGRRSTTAGCTISSALPEKTLLTSVHRAWIYARMGLLDGKAATNRKEPDRPGASNMGKVPIERLAEIAPKVRVSRARVVDSGRLISAGGIASGMEMGFHLLRRAGYDETFIGEVARVME